MQHPRTEPPLPNWDELCPAAAAAPDPAAVEPAAALAAAAADPGEAAQAVEAHLDHYEHQDQRQDQGPALGNHLVPVGNLSVLSVRTVSHLFMVRRRLCSGDVIESAQ